MAICFPNVIIEKNTNIEEKGVCSWIKNTSITPNTIAKNKEGNVCQNIRKIN
jgi:hypothetical protein